MKINNHYVPQVYLKQWSKKNKIFSYELLVPNNNCPIWKKNSISTTSSLNYLYLYDDNNQLTEELENFFSNEIEEYFPNFIKKINNYDLLTSEDSEYISKLVASQYLRTLHGYLRCKDMLSKTMENTFNETVKEVTEKFKSNSINNDQLKSLDKNDNLLTFHTKIHNQKDVESYLEFKCIIGKSMWIYSINYLLSGTFKVLNNISWCIYDAPEHFEWVTSDDPVIFLNYYGENNYDFKGGWGNKNTNVIFPLSPTKLLFAQIGLTQEALYKKADLSFANFIQKFIVENAFLKIYASKENTTVPQIRPRTVNKKEFLRIKEEINKMHEKYINEELSYAKPNKRG